MASMLRGGRGFGLFGIGLAGALGLLSGCSSGGGSGSGGSSASTAAPAATASSTPHPSLTAPRALHTATLLPNGAVLVAGGVDASGQAVASTFIVTASAVQAGPSLAQARVGHTATLLANGKVLLAGGEGVVAGAASVLGSTEIYDPVAGAFTAGPALATPRMEAVAVAYGSPSAQHVLIAGGSNGTTAIATAEDYNEATNAMAPLAAPMVQGRASGSAGLMDNGTIVIVGGDTASGPAGAEVFDPATGMFSAATISVAASGGAFASIGADAIYAGGQTATGVQAQSEVYNDTAKVFAAGPSLLSARRDATASVVNGNEIVFVGGRSGTTPVGAVEVITGNPQTGAVKAAMPLATARYGHTATPLSSGHVLVIGGMGPGNTILASVEDVNPNNTTTPRVGSTGAPAVSTPSTTTTTPTTKPTPTPSPSPSTAPASGSGSGGLLGTLGSLLGSLFGGSSGSGGGIGSAISGILGSLLGGGSSSSSSSSGNASGSSGSGLSGILGSLINSVLGGGTNTSGSGGLGGALGGLLGGLLGGGSSGGGLGGLLGSLFGGGSSSSSGSGTTSGSSSGSNPGTTSSGKLAVVSLTPGAGPAGTAVKIVVSGAGPAVGIAMDDGNGNYTNITGAQAFQSGNNVEIDFTIPALATGNYYIDVYSFASSAANAQPTGAVQAPFQVQ